MKFKIKSQYEYDYETTDRHVVSSEIITKQDDAYTIRELLLRAHSGTLPNFNINDNFDEEPDFDNVDISTYHNDIADVYNELNYLREKIENEKNNKKNSENSNKENKKTINSEDSQRIENSANDSNNERSEAN